MNKINLNAKNITDNKLKNKLLCQKSKLHPLGWRQLRYNFSFLSILKTKGPIVFLINWKMKGKFNNDIK